MRPDETPGSRALRGPGFRYNVAGTRRTFLSGLTTLGAMASLPAWGQAPSNVIRRIGLLLGEDPEGGSKVFRETLVQLGHVEGRNLQIETRSSTRTAELVELAAELGRMDLELVVVHALPMALAMRAANPAMPLVVVTTPGLVTNGFAKSVEHPGGNTTGIDELPPGVTAKRLELLKTAAPTVSRVALLSTTPGRGAHETQVADAQEAAAKLRLETKVYRATSIPEIRSALEAAAADRMDGLLNFQGGLSYVNRQMIVDWAREHRVPAIYQATVFAAAGGLMTWAPDLVEQFRIAAKYVDQILRGAKPGDLALSYPPRYFLTLNKTAARDLGIEFPPELVAKADRILP